MFSMKVAIIIQGEGYITNNIPKCFDFLEMEVIMNFNQKSLVGVSL